MLIADDIEDNRQLLAQLLGPVGFEIRLATNGAEAVEAFEQWHPCLILMDFPGKRRLLLVALRRGPVRAVVDRLRARRGRPPLEIPPDP